MPKLRHAQRAHREEMRGVWRGIAGANPTGGSPRRNGWAKSAASSGETGWGRAAKSATCAAKGATCTAKGATCTAKSAAYAAKSTAKVFPFY